MITLAPEKVLAARERSGLQVAPAARQAKVNYKTILQYEGRGDGPPPKRPKLETLLALSRTYGCSPREFATDPKDWDRIAADLGLSDAPTPESTHA